MTVPSKRLVGLLLTATLALAGGMARAQAWQDASSAANTDWQQGVLKSSETAASTGGWHAAGQRAATVGQAVDRPAMTAPASSPVRRTSYESNALARAAAPREDAAPRHRPVRFVSQEETTGPGDTQFEPMASEGVFEEPAPRPRRGCASCGGGGGAPVDGEIGGDCAECGAGAPCGAVVGEPCGEVCDFGWEVFDGHCGRWLRGLSIFTGADAFKGPLDRGANGNFGLNEGLNLARPLGDPWGCGYQIGFNAVQSNFSGAPTITAGDYSLRAPYRKQYFTTAGIFRRAEGCGLQWGVAYDYLHDNYYQNVDLQQVRSETSWVLDPVYEIGYYGAYGVGTDRVVDGKLDTTDMFVFFIRRNFQNGGDGRIWGGATGNGDGLLGVDLWVPLGSSFALENRINYMIPKEGRSDTGQVRESWGLVIQLVWYPGQNAKCQRQNPYRPIFNVADNSLFMVDRLTNR